MKKLFLAIALCLASGSAVAQCNGVFAAHTVCGNNSASSGIPGQIPQSAVTGIPGGSDRQVQYNNNGAFGGANLYYSVAGFLGIQTSSPLGLLDIYNISATNLQAILARGPTDNNFQLYVANGNSGSAFGTPQATIGLQYSGVGSGSSIQFSKGSSTTDGFLDLNPNGNQIRIGPGAAHSGLINIKGSSNDSLIFYMEGAGSPASPGASINWHMVDYSTGHSAQMFFDAVNSALTVQQGAIIINPGFIFWDAGHEQSDIDFIGYMNGVGGTGFLQLYSGCQSAFNNTFGGCPSDQPPQFAPATNFLFNSGGVQGAGQRWLTTFSMNLDLGTNNNAIHPSIFFKDASSIAGATVGVISALTDSNGMKYDAAGHNFVAGGITMGSPTGGNKGVGTINLSADIYKNNTAYTNPDYVFEKHFRGKIERFAGNPGATSYTNTLTIDQAEAIARTTLRLPGITDEPMGAFERSDKVLEKVEEAYVHLFELNARLKAVEACLSSWRCRLFGG